MKLVPKQEEAILRNSGLLEIIPLEIMREIKEMYKDPARHYHDWGHALSVISWANHVCTVFPDMLYPYTPEDMVMAALMHDAVYSPEHGSPQNEENSIDVMRQMGFHFPRTEELIRATAKHGEQENQQLHTAVKFFLDCDLAYAFADPRYEVFEYFNHLIELEYMKVYEPELVFAGRRKFLKKMLETERIFLSDHIFWRFERHTRHNMERLLSEGPSPVESDSLH